MYRIRRHGGGRSNWTSASPGPTCLLRPRPQTASSVRPTTVLLSEKSSSPLRTNIMTPTPPKNLHTSVGNRSRPKTARAYRPATEIAPRRNYFHEKTTNAVITPPPFPPRRPSLVVSSQAALLKMKKILREKYSGTTLVRKIFRSWDKNQDVSLSRDEMRRTLDSIGVFQSLGKIQTNLALQCLFDQQGGKDSNEHTKNNVSYATFANLICGEEEKQALENSDNTSVSEKMHPSTMDEQQQQQHLTAEQVLETLYQKYESRHLKSIFRHWDDNKDGVISKHEFKQALADRGMRPTSSVFNELFDRFDTQKDGTIRFADFADTVTALHGIKKRRRRRKQSKKSKVVQTSPGKEREEEDLLIFSRSKDRVQQVQGWNKDVHSSKISQKELRRRLQHHGLFFSEREFQVMIHDVQVDGIVDGEAFKIQMKPPEGLLKPTGFDFTQLPIRPTRYENTPRKDTKNMLRQTDDKNNYVSETQQQMDPSTRLFTEERADKNHRQRLYQERLVRLRKNEARVERANVRDSTERATERRVRTLATHRAQFFERLNRSPRTTCGK